jgi:hypothetical protein
MVFDYYELQRIEKWKEFRDALETSETPFEDVVNLWSKAPFVNKYLNPYNYTSWPNPWELLVDGKFDELALVIGMTYTIKLTERFKNSNIKICLVPDTKDITYFLIVDDRYVLNYEYRKILLIDQITNVNGTILRQI